MYTMILAIFQPNYYILEYLYTEGAILYLYFSISIEFLTKDRVEWGFQGIVKWYYSNCAVVLLMVKLLRVRKVLFLLSFSDPSSLSLSMRVHLFHISNILKPCKKMYVMCDDLKWVLFFMNDFVIVNGSVNFF